MSIPKNIEVLTPWERLEDKSRAELLSTELAKEVSAGHVLYGLEARAVATRGDQDDVLFEIEGGAMPLAVVHMTWRKESDPAWPRTKLFRDWEQWARESMLPHHLDFEWPNQ